MNVHTVIGVEHVSRLNPFFYMFFEFFSGMVKSFRKTQATANQTSMRYIGFLPMLIIYHSDLYMSENSEDGLAHVTPPKTRVFFQSKKAGVFDRCMDWSCGEVVSMMEKMADKIEGEADKETLGRKSETNLEFWDVKVRKVLGVLGSVGWPQTVVFLVFSRGTVLSF